MRRRLTLSSALRFRNAHGGRAAPPAATARVEGVDYSGLSSKPFKAWRYEPPLVIFAPPSSVITYSPLSQGSIWRMRPMLTM